MSPPPATVLVYMAKWVAILAVALASGGGVRAAAAAAALALLFAGLWRGHRLAWALLLVLEAAIAVAAAAGAAPWWALPLSLAALGLLLAPPSRRHVGLPRAASSAR